MGRTFEALGSRLRKAATEESAAALPFPTTEPDQELETAGPELVPVRDDDLPGDDNQIPYIEVGGPRQKTTQPTAAPEPKLAPSAPSTAVAFHLFAPEQEAILGTPAPDIVSYHQPEHPTARQYRLLSDGIAAQHPGSKSPVLLFTSATTRPAGMATVANLAVTRAADGCGRVLVVELERSSGSVAERLGASSMPGLRELLARTVPLSLAVHRTAVEGVYLIPPGKTRVGSEENARLPELLDQLRGRFDWILVDAPIWGTYPLEDWAKTSDGVYLVLGQDEWDSPLADAAADGIARIGGRLRGCITIAESGMVLPKKSESASTDSHSRGNEVVDHVGAPVGVASRRLSGPQIVRRSGDE